MVKGLSSDLVFRILVQGSPYLLRVITRVNEQTDPARHFGCLRIASGAGLAPHLRYASVEDGICITDFIEAAPLSVTEALIRIPRTLRRLHAAPLFPKAFNYVTAHKGFIWRFRTANLVPSSQIEEIFPRYAQICAVYPRLDADMVSCHNDLKPENILFDGQRLWLVDWQAAFVNDRYFDLSVAANFVVRCHSDERTYLEQYFGHAPGEYQLARFFLMRQGVHMLAATVFLLLAARDRPVDLSEPLPSFEDFHQRIWDGEVNLADSALRGLYGRLHWEQLLRNVREARFEDAIRIVSRRHTDAPALFPEAP